MVNGTKGVIKRGGNARYGSLCLLGVINELYGDLLMGLVRRESDSVGLIGLGVVALMGPGVFGGDAAGS